MTRCTSPWRKDAIGPNYRGAFTTPKLTPAQRDEIRDRLADGEDPRDLALEYGVTAGTIRYYR